MYSPVPPAGMSPCRGIARGTQKKRVEESTGMPKLRLRIDFEPAGSLGPGKVAVLEAIRRCGSISSAARDLDMSYRRAWLLIDDMNQTFRQPVVSAAAGGKKGGGTELTPFGDSVIRHFREMEREAHASLARHMLALQDEVAELQGEDEEHKTLTRSLAKQMATRC